ncbi:SmtA SAM-dependent methyltransferases [Methylophilaceae bacterium]|jgi:SAM-dependent methyltransferase
MLSLQNIAMCPNCASIKLSWHNTTVSCPDCLTEFQREAEFVDFLENKLLNKLEIKALEVWGADLHATAMSAPAHYVQIQSLYPDVWQQAVKGNVLEIGCGSGTDTIHLSKLNESISLFSFDLGSNVAGLSKLLKTNKNTTVFRASALQIPIKNETIDMVYSFGVFHHTRNPEKCFEEAYRVMNKKGVLFFYLYSAHEDNPIKYAGVFLENGVMHTLSFIPEFLHKPFLFILSISCLLLFSWPAQLLKLFGFVSISKKFPMFWGTTPASIIPDLKDRLLAPVNHRFKLKDLKNLIKSCLFREVHIKKTSAGLFGYCIK